MALPACSIPARETPTATEAPRFSERKLVLVFEREGSFSPVAGAHVNVAIAPPATLNFPPDGNAVTGPQGEVQVSYRPVAIYDQPALNDGDVIADYPASFLVSLRTHGGVVYEWRFEENLSYARYSDPLYQGLNRDPNPGPSYFNLTLPGGP
jgi:hypothetical protein